MRCGAVRHRLSEYIDGDLRPSEARSVSAHLGSCPACADRIETLRSTLARLADLPRLTSPEPIASRVEGRLEVESRGPGLALVFRSAWAARPFILPSLLPAAAVVCTLLAVAASLGGGPDWTTGAGWARGRPAYGTEANPLSPSSEVSVPRSPTVHSLSERALVGMSEGTLFLETVVARDGSVSTVRLLDGDSERARPLLEALRRERFEPVHFRGRPVAVSVYRLISFMEVRSPVT